MTDRQQDILHLDWLKRARAGETLQSIADLYGVSKHSVAGRLRRINRDYKASEAA